MQVEIERLDGPYQFEASSKEQSIHITANPNMAGEGSVGLRPMELLLSALGGCMSIDVLNILYKQRQAVEAFKVKVSGERSDTVPAVFTRIDIHIELRGEVEESRLQRAIDLSVNRYCSVHHMLAGQVDIHTDYTLDYVK